MGNLAYKNTSSDIIKFEPDQPQIVQLKYATGREVSAARNGERRFMFSTEDGRIMFFGEVETGFIASLNLKPGELLQITKRRNCYEIGRLQGVPPRPATHERQFEQPRQAEPGRTSTAAVSTITTQAVSSEHNHSQAITTPEGAPLVKHTLLSQWMAGSYIAALDAILEAQKYASAKNIVMKFSEETVQASANSIFIAFTKDLEKRGGLAAWRK